MKSNKTILVTGSNGQLGKTIQKKSLKKKEFDWIFLPKEDLNITKVIEIKNDKIESKCGWSPFDGYKLKGTPVYTIINGEVKMKYGEIIGQASGKPIRFLD